MKFILVTALVSSTSLFLSSCSSSGTGSNGPEDTSASGTAAAMVGGANSGTTTGGTLSLLYTPAHHKFNLAEILNPIREAQASGACPTILSAAGSGCADTSADVLTLTYNNCSRGSGATLNGTVTVTANAGISCGTAPSGISSINFGGNATRTSPAGTSVVVDSSGAGDPSWTTVSGGTTVTFSSASNRTITIPGVDLNSAGHFWHTITTNGGSGVTINSGVANGTVTVFHNLLKIQGTSSFSNVTFNPATCCTPISGTITTTFSAIGGVTPTAKGNTIINAAPETLTFTSCGAATYSGADQTAGSVSVDQCY